MPNSEMRERARKWLLATSHMNTDSGLLESILAAFGSTVKRETVEECAKTAEEIPFLPTTHESMVVSQTYSYEVGKRLRSKLAAPSVEQKGSEK